jgi:hypothetical protein
MLKIGNPRIAVCFSGQPRTWRKCVESWKENLFGHLEMDVFCHTWDFNTPPNCVSVGMNVIDNQVHDGEIDELYEVLKPKKFLIEQRKNFVPFKMTQPILVPSFLSQFYGIMQAARLKKQYEIENDFQYDVVIKMRYDAYLKTPIFQEFTNINNTNQIDPWSMYCFHYGWDKVNNRGRVGDIFWYANSETYDIISDYYLNLGDMESRFYKTNENTLIDLPAETIFYSYLKKNDINFKTNHTWDIKLFRENKQFAYSEDQNGYEIW